MKDINVECPMCQGPCKLKADSKDPCPLCVSQSSDNKVQDLEDAMIRMCSAIGDAEIETAYANLNHCRHTLYLMIQSAEQALGIKRTVQRKFL